MTREGKTDFLWYGAKYYGFAIQAMAAEVSVNAGANFGLSPDGLPWAEHARSQPEDGNVSWMEVRLVAAEIMCYYEELSGSFRAWGRHLDGIFQLLQLDQPGSQTSASLLTQSQASLWQALPPPLFERTFWRFVQNDIEQSFISKKQTRLSKCHASVWQFLGLSDDVESGILSDRVSDPSHQAFLDPGSKALGSILRCLTKTFDLQSAGAASEVDVRDIGPSFDGALRREWLVMERCLDAWKETYEVVRPDIERPPRAMPGVSEIWFADDQYALAWTYHCVCRILLLMHLPVHADVAPQHRWFDTYRALHCKMAEYAREILSLNLGRPNTAIRSRMIQPLYIAGQCFTQENERRLVVNLLRGLEDDLGLASGYRVQALLEEWQTPHLMESSNLDAELSDLSS